MFPCQSDDQKTCVAATLFANVKYDVSGNTMATYCLNSSGLPRQPSVTSVHDTLT